MPAYLPRILITTGEPAGIGADIVCQLAQREWPAQIAVLADPELLARRAQQLGLPLSLRLLDTAAMTPAHRAGHLPVLPVATRCSVEAGRLDPHNAAYVLETLDWATDLCASGSADAMVTAPVHKGVINDAGIRFSGHTEYLAERLSRPGHVVHPVMMLAAGALRVALVTTHLPLRAVADAITPARLERVIRILDTDLRRIFAIDRPRILVCGLNPHAGEGGHLGREEIDIIEPVLAALRNEGLDLEGPLPADTLFTPRRLAGADAVLAMYHDQGLPVLKHAGFGESVNITLGLPILRTSVDHGTALDLAGSGRADAGSLGAALELAIELSLRRRPARP